MSGRGGRRPGAGRPAKHIIYESPIRVAEAKIRDRLPGIVDKLLELSEGIYEEKPMGDEMVIVYRRRPDRQACEYLLDRLMGKPKQGVEHGGEVDVTLQTARRLLRVVGGGGDD